MKEIKIINHIRLDKIEAIEDLRAQKSELEKKEIVLSAPILTDFTLIDLLYEWFKEGLAGKNCPPRCDCVTQRKKFLFLILYLYSPVTLAGGKMIKGLRDKLAQVLDIQSGSTISDNCADVIFFYNRYKYFKNEVDDLFCFLTDKLEEKGIISRNTDGHK